MKWLKALTAKYNGCSPTYIYLLLSNKPPNTSWFSLSDSPYPAHVLGYAADIYAPYPYMPAEEGVVSDILKVPTPKYRDDSITTDWVVIIDLGNGSALKVLHVRPQVRIGDKVFLGDQLGNYVISGYFQPWSEAHMHVEVRPSKDLLRVRGGCKLAPTNELLNILGAAVPVHTNEFRVTFTSKSFYLVKPANGSFIFTNLGNLKYVCDCGIPHYGYGAAIGNNTIRHNELEGKHLRILGYDVGVVELIDTYRLVFTPKSTPYINKVSAYGIGTYILRNEVKIIPSQQLRQLNLKEGDVITLEFEYSSECKINHALKYLKKR